MFIGMLLAVGVAWAIVALRGAGRRGEWARVARRADEVARRRLQHGVPARSEALVAGPGWLDGVLRTPAPLISRARGRGGSPLRRWGARVSPPQDLALEIGDRRVAIQGPLRIAVGSAQRFGCGVTRVLRDGDRVRVRGRLAPSALAADYRSAAHETWRVEAEHETVDIAALGEARQRLGWLRVMALGAPARVALPLLVASLVAVPAGVAGVWKGARVATCRQLPGCALDGLCGARWSGLGWACAATEDAHCLDAAACLEDGRCAAREGRCQLRDCSGPCRDKGACTPDGPRCVVASDADCAGSWYCEHRGMCTARGGRCVLTVDQRQDCSSHITCASHGHCSSTPKGCLAATRDDCLGARDCRVRGRCSPDGAGLCRALSDADCADSQVCRELGFCTAVEGGCAASQVDRCGASTECDYRAKCAGVDGACVPTAEAHCRLSLLCTLENRCRIEGTTCVE